MVKVLTRVASERPHNCRNARQRPLINLYFLYTVFHSLYIYAPEINRYSYLFNVTTILFLKSNNTAFSLTKEGYVLTRMRDDRLICEHNP